MTDVIAAGHTALAGVGVLPCPPEGASRARG